MREAQKKLALLVRSRADLNAKMPVSGDSPLHILARVYNTLSSRACEGTDTGDGIGGQKDALQFASCTQSRIQMLVGAGASTTAFNAEGKKPISLISGRFQQQLLLALMQRGATGADISVALGATPVTKGQPKGCIRILDDGIKGDDCLE
jgi:hypothetical protein